MKTNHDTIPIDQKLKLEELCKLRHSLHRANFNTSKNLYSYNLKRMASLLSDLKLTGISNIDVSSEVEELLYYFDEKDYDVFKGAKDILNDKVEDYLKAVDTIYNTKYCPEGHLRSKEYIQQNDVIAIKKGMVYWCERKLNGLFTQDDERGKRIPAIIVSSDKWNKSHDYYVALSIAKKDYSASDKEFNVDFIFNDTDHIIRCFNPFTVRKEHLDEYITTIDSIMLDKIDTMMAEFYGYQKVETSQEVELSKKIETIMREKFKYIQNQMVQESYNKSMQLFLNKLNSMYPTGGNASNNSNSYDSNNQIHNVQCDQTNINIPLQHNTNESEQVTLNLPLPNDETKNTTISGRNKWDKETARQFINDYNTMPHRKELARKYGFKSVGSLYTRYGKCKEILQEA